MKANRAALLFLFVFASQAVAHPGHGAPGWFHLHFAEIALAVTALCALGGLLLRRSLKR